MPAAVRESGTLELELSPALKAPAARPELPSYVPVVRCSLVREGKLPVEKRTLRTAADAAAVLADYLEGADRETFVALFLDCRKAVIGIHTVSLGTLTESLVHPRETFKAAILAGADAVIFGHNHPSGVPDPSPADVSATRRLREAGKILGIDVLDHVVIGERRANGTPLYASLSERSLL